MLFRILGPLQVHTGEGWNGIRARRSRALLAAVLLRRGQVVPVDRLVDELWGEGPPPRARKLVSGYVAQLRRVMGDEGGQVLVTRAPGYQILTDPADLDAGKFAGLLADGRRALAERDAGRAAALLASALGLWRGPALADVPPSAFVATEASRLRESRLDALELRIEADLACGRYAEVIAELRTLTAEHPFREHMWGLLIRALQATGRQAQALQVYAQASRVIADELGCGPGAELQRLHQQTRSGNRGQPQLWPPPGRLALRTLSVLPRQLPPCTWRFTGRARELQALHQLAGQVREARGAVMIAVIAGTAGIGKTALAVQWAHQVADRFPDGQLYADLRGFHPSGEPLSPSEVICGFLGAFGVPADQIPAGLDAQASLYRSVLAGKRVLVVLDNARDAGHARPLLPGSPGCLVVITSRAALTDLAASEGAHLLTLDVLPEQDASQLLDRHLGAGRLAAEPEAARELIGLCAGLPLALSVAAARAATSPGLPLASLVAELKQARSRLDALDAGGTSGNVRTVFSWSYERLSDGAARMFRLLGLHPGPDISEPAAASLAGVPPAQANRDLAGLTRAHLAAASAHGRFTMHDLLRAYAADLALARDGEPGCREAVHRMADHYLHSAHAAAALLYPARAVLPLGGPRAGAEPEHFTGTKPAGEWLQAEYPVLMAVTALAADTGLAVHAWQIPCTLTEYQDRHGHWHDWVAAQRIALAAAQQLGDLQAEGYAHRDLGHACARIGDYGAASEHAERALTIYQRLGDLAGLARVRYSLARLAELQSSPQQALAHASEALTLYEQAGHSCGHARMLNAVGWYHAQLGSYRKALDYCRRAIAQLVDLGDPGGQADTWDSLGYAYHHLGDYGEAAACYARAERLYEDLGDRGSLACTLSHTGDAYRAAGNPAARSAWQRALAILDDLHHPDAIKVRVKLYAFGAVAPG